MKTLTRDADGAILSDDGVYRFKLWRELPDYEYAPVDEVTVLYVMVNPSTADHRVDDPTIRRCISFAQREGATRLEVVNLFPFRSAKPAALKAWLKNPATDPPTNENFSYIVEAVKRADFVILAWGATAASCGEAGRSMKDAVLSLESTARGGKFFCLGKTKDGEPRHPLMVKADQELIAWQ